MLDMGFLPDLQRILNLLPKERQTLLFSATFSPEIKKLAATYLRNPQTIEVARSNSTATNVTQIVYEVAEGDKTGAVVQLIRERGLKQVIVFCNSKIGASRLARQLERSGVVATAIHGDRTQSERMQALDAFKRGEIEALVATDVAARGLDIAELPAVINFDLPFNAEDYVHRIGRTGRAGRSGIAINLVNHNDTFQWRRIERFVDRRIDASVVEGLEPKRSAKPRTGGPRAGGDRGGYRGNGGNGGGYRGQREGYGARQGSNGGTGGNSEGRFQRSFGGDRDGFAPRRDDRNGNSNSNGGGYQGAQREWNRDDRAPRQSYGQGQQNRGDWQQRPARTQGTQDGNRGYGNSAGNSNGGGYGNRDGNRESYGNRESAPRRFGDNNGGSRFGDGGNGAQRRSYGNRDGNRESYGSKGRSRDFDR
jgi:superfamily II DNA/RNA helicase